LTTRNEHGLRNWMKDSFWKRMLFGVVKLQQSATGPVRSAVYNGGCRAVFCTLLSARSVQTKKL
jgi:hypothetical protein